MGSFVTALYSVFITTYFPSCLSLLFFLLLCMSAPFLHKGQHKPFLSFHFLSFLVELELEAVSDVSRRACK